MPRCNNTKFLVVGPDVTAADAAPMDLGGVKIECTGEFRYRGPLFHHWGHSSRDVNSSIATASQAGGA